MEMQAYDILTDTQLQQEFIQQLEEQNYIQNQYLYTTIQQSLGVLIESIALDYNSVRRGWVLSNQKYIDAIHSAVNLFVVKLGNPDLIKNNQNLELLTQFIHLLFLTQKENVQFLQIKDILFNLLQIQVFTEEFDLLRFQCIQCIRCQYVGYISQQSQQFFINMRQIVSYWQQQSKQQINQKVSLCQLNLELFHQMLMEICRMQFFKLQSAFINQYALFIQQLANDTFQYIQQSLTDIYNQKIFIQQQLRFLAEYYKFITEDFKIQLQVFINIFLICSDYDTKQYSFQIIEQLVFQDFFQDTYIMQEQLQYYSYNGMTFLQYTAELFLDIQIDFHQKITQLLQNITYPKYNDELLSYVFDKIKNDIQKYGQCFELLQCIIFQNQDNFISHLQTIGYRKVLQRIQYQVQEISNLSHESKYEEKCLQTLDKIKSLYKCINQLLNNDNIIQLMKNEFQGLYQQLDDEQDEDNQWSIS